MFVDEKRQGEVHVRPMWRQYLDDAADEIERRGWTQFTLRQSDGSMCMKGALNMVLTGSAISMYLGNNRDKMLAECALCRILPATFNDKPGRTKAEVVAKFRELASS